MILILNTKYKILICGPEEIRTLNPLHAMEVRYRYATGPYY